MRVVESGAPAGDHLLRSALRRADRRKRVRALMLIAPLFIFLMINFIVPIGLMLLRSVQDPELARAMPHTATAMRAWQGGGLPDNAIAALFVNELAVARDNGTLSLIANRLNYDINGFRTLLSRTARNVPLPDASSALDQLIRVDPRWGDSAFWAALKHAAGPQTSFYLLAALDRRLDSGGNIVHVPSERAVFVDIFGRTFWISLIVTLACLVLGYPTAYLLASLPTRISNLLLILVLLPFWTPVLVRTTAWVVLLQREGIVNKLLGLLGVTTEPLALIYNRTGVYIAMTYVLLPFMVLPLYGVMRGISPNGMKAAMSLGAHPFIAFLRVYLPQTLPGLNAGCLLVFILAIGFYITPALVGGANDQMVSYFIAFYTNETLNWGMASALALVLLAATLLLYLVYVPLAGTAGPKWS